MINQTIQSLNKSELIDIIEIYAKDWLAMDGVWFQAVESRYGMDAAMECDIDIWKKFTVIEAKKIKKFLGLENHAGIQGLEKALKLRLYSCINKDEIIIEGNTLTYRTLECRVQHARKEKGMDFHPCKYVGIGEYELFAKTIDDRFTCECISCFPHITDDTCNCSWKFYL